MKSSKKNVTFKYLNNVQEKDLIKIRDNSPTAVAPVTTKRLEMMIKSGVRGSDGEPVTKSLAGQKMDDGKLIAEWTYSAEGRVLEPQKLEVSGNAYSQYKISRTDANVVYNDDKAFLTHWGFAEPTGMPSRSGLGLWGWIIIGVIGLAVVVFVYFKPRGNR
jgi:hypothetical protein